MAIRALCCLTFLCLLHCPVLRTDADDTPVPASSRRRAEPLLGVPRGQREEVPRGQVKERPRGQEPRSLIFKRAAYESEQRRARIQERKWLGYSAQRPMYPQSSYAADLNPPGWTWPAGYYRIGW